MVNDIKERDEWEKNRPFREWAERIAVVIGSIFFFGWLLISLWFAFYGVKDNACASVSGDAYYCGD